MGSGSGSSGVETFCGLFSFPSWLRSPGAGRYDCFFMGHLLFEPGHSISCPVRLVRNNIFDLW